MGVLVVDGLQCDGKACARSTWRPTARAGAWPRRSP